jgi:hypothetical protein
MLQANVSRLGFRVSGLKLETRDIRPKQKGTSDWSETMAPIAKQDIRFCKTVDGVTIAYSTMGQGLPLVIPPQFVTHL